MVDQTQNPGKTLEEAVDYFIFSARDIGLYCDEGVDLDGDPWLALIASVYLVTPEEVLALIRSRCEHHFPAEA